MVARIIPCAQCEKPFFVTDAEVELLESRGFDLPRRCTECRRRKWKAANNAGDIRLEDRKRRHRRKSPDLEMWR